MSQKLCFSFACKMLCDTEKCNTRSQITTTFASFKLFTICVLHQSATNPLAGFRFCCVCSFRSNLGIEKNSELGWQSTADHAKYRAPCYSIRYLCVWENTHICELCFSSVSVSLFFCQPFGRVVCLLFRFGCWFVHLWNIQLLTNYLLHNALYTVEYLVLVAEIPNSKSSHVCELKTLQL